jgi:dolichol-phosphate mannosyltransferase
MLETLAARDERIGVIELSRNFGKELALTAGLHALDCDAVIIMDADLQHPPAYIPEMIAKWEEGYEIVATRRTKSDRQPLVRRLGSNLFYWLLNSMSEFKMEPGTTDFRLLDRIVVDALKQFTENNRMVRGLIDWMGFKKTFIEFEAPDRHSGKPGYSYTRLFQLALNSFTAFSLVPLKLAGYLGMFVITAFGLLLAFMIADKFWMGGRFGFTPISFVIVTNVIMNGVVLACIGLVALYIGHIHTEVIGRPLYLIRKSVGVRK